MEVLVSRILRIEGPWFPGSHVRKLLQHKELCRNEDIRVSIWL